MATGYVVSGRGDLDIMFKARVGGAAAATGFLSNGGVDLCQRFEQRGASAAIAATGFKTVSNDLAQIFRGISAGDMTMLAKGDTITNGYSDGKIFTSTGSGGSTLVPATFNGYTVSAVIISLGSPIICFVGGAIPPNTDAVWRQVVIDGVFSDSASPGTLTLLRSTTTSYSTGTFNGFNHADWYFGATAKNFVANNSYGVTFSL